MAEPIDFYFDFSSPYGYFASRRIDELAARHGRGVEWRPILLGLVFERTGGQPLPAVPLKGDYARRDMLRSARYLGLPFVFPEKFPFGSTAAVRCYYWLRDGDAARARDYARAVYAACFGRGEDISAPDTAIALAARAGADEAALRVALTEPSVKERPRVETTAAIERGVFGSPYFIIDGEPFWGHDRLDQMERWLSSGPY